MTIANLIEEARFTVLLGKNGAGKSTILRSFSDTTDVNIKYISPERGGKLKYDPQVDSKIESNENWMRLTRQNNRFEQFREQSTAQFRTLELLMLREIELIPNIRNDSSKNFQSIAIDTINDLLFAVNLVRTNRGFSFTTKNGSPIPEEKYRVERPK